MLIVVNDTISCINMRLILCFVLGLPLILKAQAVDSFEILFEQQYAKNILLEEINGVYIPEDVTDVFTELDRLSNEQSREKMKQGDEKIVSQRLTRGLGKWMIVNWNFYEGSRLSHHLKSLGVTHPDDMALFLVVSYYRHLNGLDQHFELRAEELRLQREKIFRESVKQRTLSVTIDKG